MQLRALIPLILLVIFVIILAGVAYVAYTIGQGVRNTTRQKMEKHDVVFSRDGMKVGVKQVSEEAEKDRSQRLVDPD